MRFHTGPRDAVVAVRRVDGAAPFRAGPGPPGVLDGGRRNVPEGREPALDVTRAFCRTSPAYHRAFNYHHCSPSRHARADAVAQHTSPFASDA